VRTLEILRPRAPSRKRVFVSYHLMDREFASRLKPQLERAGFAVWSDWTARSSIRRWALRRRQLEESESGLDSWLTSGVLRSDLIFILTRPGPFGYTFDKFSKTANDTFINVHMQGELIPRLYSDVGFSFYFSNLRKFWQNEYYRSIMGYRLAKDFREPWQAWEMRVARAMRLPAVLCVLADTDAEAIDELIDAQIEMINRRRVEMAEDRQRMNQFLRDRLKISNDDPLYFSDAPRDRSGEVLRLDNVFLLRESALEEDFQKGPFSAMRALLQDDSLFKAGRTWKSRFRLVRFFSPLAVVVVVFTVVAAMVRESLGLTPWNDSKAQNETRRNDIELP
jgi:hypothetical protein